MHHIAHQQTWDHPFMSDAQMAKPCNQANHVYYISQPYIIKNVRVVSYPVSHIYHVSQLASSSILYSQIFSNRRKSKLNTMEKYSSRDQDTEEMDFGKSHSRLRSVHHQHQHRNNRSITYIKPHHYHT